MAEHSAFRNVFGDLMVKETSESGVVYLKIAESTIRSIGLSHPRNAMTWDVTVQHTHGATRFACESTKAAQRLFRELCDMTKIDLQPANPASVQDEPAPESAVLAPDRPAPEGLLGTWLPNPGVEVFGPFVDVDLSGIIGKTVTDKSVTVEVGPIPPPDDECPRLLIPDAGVKVLTSAGWVWMAPEEKPQVTTVVNNGITPGQLAEAIANWNGFEATRPAKSILNEDKDGNPVLVTSRGDWRVWDSDKPLECKSIGVHLHGFGGSTGYYVYDNESIITRGMTAEEAKTYIEENY